MGTFNFTPTSGDGCFHIGKKPSLFKDGIEFKLNSVVTGAWTDANGTPVYKDKDANSIRFKSSLSEELDDAININKFISYRKVVYDSNGHAKILYDFENHSELLDFLEKKIGRDPNDVTKLIGTAKEIGQKVLSEFFGNKTIVAKKQSDLFFKTVKDGVEKLEAPYDDIIVLAFKD